MNNHLASTKFILNFLLDKMLFYTFVLNFHFNMQYILNFSISFKLIRFVKITDENLKNVKRKKYTNA